MNTERSLQFLPYYLLGVTMKNFEERLKLGEGTKFREWTRRT